MGVRISVIVPIYNMEQFLDRCLGSLTSQAYGNLEFILVNDGSTDSSAEICDRYAQEDARIKLVHQQNGGVSSARNTGLNIATGDYLSFVDPDDRIASGAYSLLAEYISDAKPDILRFGAYRKGEELDWLPFEGLYEGSGFEKEVVLPMIGSDKFGGMFILGVLWLHLFKRDLIEQNDIRFNPKLRRCEDRLFTISAMINASNMLFVRDNLYHYEVNDESLSNRYDPARWEQESLFLSDLKQLYHQKKDSAFIEEADKRIANDYILRVITSVNQEYFTNNNNSFWRRYKNIKKIICNPEVKKAAYGMRTGQLGLKGRLIIGMIKYRLAFLLNVFNTIILLKNKLNSNG
ncbi:glycosyltransferase [Dysgonomonas macrotermitis]|uniref:Glycosyltransferase EpsJ n=1 Tax=Dysgonomonas macrotermitis TaxID=1346286 RepID=A0A1M4UBM2_9BACT|nr:glycosyltransferase [Dysgonomonas macrotermitis]SHE54261.1 glycosyltransferase EpsJ [Dysgonomonas macrotermitis]